MILSGGTRYIFLSPEQQKEIRRIMRDANKNNEDFYIAVPNENSAGWIVEYGVKTRDEVAALSLKGVRE